MTRSMMARITPVEGQTSQVRHHVEALARRVRREAGNIRFETHEASDASGFVIIEEYRDDDAFQRHLAMPHTQQFNAALESLAEGGGSSVTELAPLGEPDDSPAEIRAIDHIGLTVPDVEAASLFFADAFGARRVYDVLPRDGEDMAGEGPEKELGLSAGTRIVHMRLMRIGNGPCLEIFQMEDGEQQAPPRLQDIGLTHFGLYVDDIQSATRRFEAAGGELLSPTHPLAGVEDGPHNAGVYGRAPWGMLVELLSYPDGIDYSNTPGNADEAKTLRWTPHP
ncbi:antibiotic biosynthesis monooxygenase [Kushneria aurantia]|uniref:Antibiotic biosynthesis monooxygenase n=1 Tax=Kushneria aurantia TaxID=504092 RepID=A0ABV6G1C7_9GAMM|nr:antibiotic biosynthesis monooxygenase [Kushneria aurantia]